MKSIVRVVASFAFCAPASAQWIEITSDEQAAQWDVDAMASLAGDAIVWTCVAVGDTGYTLSRSGSSPWQTAAIWSIPEGSANGLFLPAFDEPGILEPNLVISTPAETRIQRLDGTPVQSLVAQPAVCAAASFDLLRVAIATTEPGGAGRVRIFRNPVIPDMWALEADLVAPEAALADGFGRALAFDSSLTPDLLVVGAKNSAFVYRRSGSEWSFDAKLEQPLGARFGSAVAVVEQQGERRIVVGAPGAGSARVGAGHLLIYADASPPVLLQTIEGSVAGGALGRTLDGSHSRLFAPLRSTPASIRQYELGAPGEMLELVREYSSTALGAGYPERFDAHAAGFAAHGRLSVPGESRWLLEFPLTGPQVEYYAFCQTGAPCGNEYGAGGCSNSTGAGGQLHLLANTNFPSDPTTWRAWASQLPPSRPAILCLSSSATAVPFGDGILGLGGQVTRYPVAMTDGAGELGVNLGLEGWRQPGYFQLWFRDPSGPCGTGSNLTNAASIEPGL